MPRLDGGERRSTDRTVLVTFCPCEFVVNGETHSALMTDVSKQGAGFTINKVGEEIVLHDGEELTYTIRTPYGSSTCKGRTIWCRHVEDGVRWGIAFTDLSADGKDPLQCFIDSPF